MGELCFHGALADSNRLQPLRQPPPTAYLTALGPPLRSLPFSCIFPPPPLRVTPFRPKPLLSAPRWSPAVLQPPARPLQPLSSRQKPLPHPLLQSPFRRPDLVPSVKCHLGAQGTGSGIPKKRKRATIHSVPSLTAGG